ncbi:hypothetical protein SCB49_12484 [unidentified eubacterium SCB49]|nr:hypothetical protein SCB49_12484 [unidentified eubacterium SCB49]
MKNLLLTTTILLIAASATAQLFVKPNGATPSYIYAENIELFVEGTIELQKNAVGDYEGSIYLRDQAQLFQGDNNTYNSGDGILSVYQTTNADQYDYNYWSSPVGVNTGTIGNTINGPLRINVSDDSAGSTTPTDIGTTNFIGGYAGSSTNNTLNIASYWLYSLPNEQIGWQHIGGNDGINAGYGFSMKGTNTSTTATAFEDPNAQTYDFRGRPNTGTVTLNLNAGESTLVGNPYPSALDLAIFFNNNSGFNEIKFWDEDRSINSHYYIDNVGGYSTWIPSGANASNSLPGMYAAPAFLNYDGNGNPEPGDAGYGGLDTYPRRFSPIGQGFMLDANINTTVSFTNEQRVFVPMDGTNSLFRSTEEENNNTEKASITDVNGATYDQSYMRLNAYFPGSHRRPMVLMFSNQSTTGFDRGYDANHPMDATSDMAMTLEDGKKLVIQTIPWNVDAIVPLMVKADLPGSIVLNAYEETNLPFTKAYLYDAYNATYQLITDGNSATANIEDVGETTNRFYIVFKSFEQIVSQITDQSGLKLAQETVDLFQDNRTAIMEILNPERFDIKEATVFDMSGKLVHTERNIGNQTRYNFPTASFSDGVYIVKLTTEENLVLDYKVTIFNKK